MKPLSASARAAGSLLAAGILASAVLCADARAGSGQSGALVGEVVVRKGGERVREPAVIYLESVPGAEPRRSRPRTVTQKHRRFRPKWLVITKGTEVRFPNDDIRIHNVFSNSRARRFDLGEYLPGKSKSVTFHHAGEVQVFCNIHPEMAATILVLENDFWTKSTGKWRLDNVPPGTYTVVAWRPHSPKDTARVTVKPGETTRVDLAIEEGEPPKHHLRKDGTPYTR